MVFSSRRIGPIAAAGMLFLAPLGAFSNVEIGDTIANREMTALGGGTQTLLGGAQANVFVFFRPDQENSRQAMRGVAALAREMAERSVSWVAVVSDQAAEEEVRTLVAEAELGMPVLLDAGDALYGELGARLYPVVGITDPDGVLVAYLHFTKVHFIELIRAHVRHQLGEISDDELAEIRNPARSEAAARGEGGNRNLRLARMLLDAGKLDKALETAQKGVELEPELAAAHALVGSILARQGDCAAALEAFARALSLDPNEPEALAGKKACEGES